MAAVPEPATLLLFAVAGLVLIVVPGPNLIFIMTRSVADGTRVGLASALGVETGTLVHVAAAAVGLSALLASSATAFDMVKYVGAAYLIYLGLKALRSRPPDPDQPAVAVGTSMARAYRQAVLVQLLNPKVAVFFLAFLPQFIDPTGGPAWIQIAGLGALLAVLGLCVDCAYAVAAGSARSWLRARPQVWARQRYVTGAVYLGLGVTAALSGRKPA
ncbi:LysE family translocator [soil metagenome]